MREISRLIRREIGTETNARFLRRMPLFRTDEALPEEMREMLARLEHAEGADSR
ncbi:MAG: hypothetical protein ACTHLP_20305 [Rhizobiaceae bacterium]